MKHISLIAASLLSAGFGGFMVYRHADRIDSIGGLVLVGFSLVCMAPASFTTMRTELSAAWRSYKDPAS